MFALRTGASGLQSFGEAMSVVGSNIANVNTTGYKANRVNFQDLLATGVAGTTTKVGKGVKISSVQGDFSQGSAQSTTRLTDLAVEGDGFFTVRTNTGRTFYTRAGNFELNKDGTLVTDKGATVLVREIDRLTGELKEPLTGARLDKITDPPQATGNGANDTGVHVAANLNTEAEVPQLQFDPTNVKAEMYNFSHAVTVYDERGAEHVVTVAFRRVADTPPQIDPATGAAIPGTGRQNQWQWYVLAPESEFGGNPEAVRAVGGGFLKFDEKGRLLEATGGRFTAPGAGQVGPEGQVIPPGPPVLVEAPLPAGAPVPQVTLPFADNPLVLGLSFGRGSNPNDPNDPRTGLDGITAFASEFKVSRMDADGYKPGTLEDFDITVNGTIMGRFDNGNNRPLYRMMVSRFVNEAGLLRAGDSLFEQSLQSGQPLNGHPAEGGFGTVAVRNLERSNVDLSSEFVRMIETQRAFQANAKSVTTSDEMLADLVAMKR